MTEASRPVNERLKNFRNRAGIGAGIGTTIVLVGATGWWLTSTGFRGSEPNTALPPAATTPDTRRSPSLLPSVSPSTVSPTEASTACAPPVLASGTSLLNETGYRQQELVGGFFGRNTGIHTLTATEDSQSLMIVTPDNSDVQQLQWRLPGQDKWMTFDPGVTGIVVRTATDMEIDTSNDRGAWFSACREGPNTAEVDVPVRVMNEFASFGFGCVDVVTVTKSGYVVQEVPQGQEYTQDIPSTFFPFTGQ